MSSQSQLTCAPVKFRVMKLLRHEQLDFARSTTMSKRVLAEVKKIIPPLSEKLHKGQAGRVGVIGGSQE